VSLWLAPAVVLPLKLSFHLGMPAEEYQNNEGQDVSIFRVSSFSLASESTMTSS
jgi:hypothetical protein